MFNKFSSITSIKWVFTTTIFIPRFIGQMLDTDTPMIIAFDRNIG